MNWLADYLEITRAQESPEIFHLWVGLATMASVLTRNVWIERRSHGKTFYKVYPGHFMIILVAPSGRGHKSTAIHMGQKLMEKVGVKILSGKGSTENVIKRISGLGTIVAAGSSITMQQPDAIATIISSELSNFLSKATYAETLIDFLMQAYDAEDHYTLMLQSGSVVLTNPTVTFLAGATPISIGESVTVKAHAAGWWSRVLPIYSEGDEKPPNPLLDIDDEDVDEEERKRVEEIETRLVVNLEKMKQLTGRFSFEPGVKEWIREWHKTYTSNPINRAEGYPTRRMDHMLRVAMLLQISKDMSLSIDIDTIKAADRALELIESYFPIALACIGQSNMAKNMERIQTAIRSFGGIATRTQILNRCHRYFNNIDELKLCIRTLVESNIIQEVLVAGVPGLRLL